MEEILKELLELEIDDCTIRQKIEMLLKKAYDIGYEDGNEEGYDSGRDDGYNDGYDYGYETAKDEFNI